MQERKKRIRVDTMVDLNGRRCAEALDLSSDGMYVITRHTFVEGVEVSLAFELDGELFDIRAKLKHVEDGLGFGVNFVDLPSQDARRLKAYVDSH